MLKHQTKHHDKIQSRIILDWINQIILTIKDEEELFNRCIKRFGKDITNKHETVIRDDYNHHIKMLENEIIINQWSNQEVDDYTEQYGNII